MKECCDDITLHCHIDCVKCGKKKDIGSMEFGGKYQMCMDCSDEFQKWMYRRLVEEWLKND